MSSLAPTVPASASPCEGADGSWKSQFSRPKGRFGWWVGHLMAWKNAPINRLAVGWLDVWEGESVLEIGFGPGTTLRLLASLVHEGDVAGVDPSEVMVRLAIARNRRAVRLGRVEPRLGAAEKLPFHDGRFGAAVAVNSFHHWEDPARGLAETRRVLSDRGRLLVVERLGRAPHRLAAPGLSKWGLEEVVRRVEKAGYREVRVLRGRAGGRDIAAVWARVERP
jgi:ubiquinone/menaquinone biosynthesis C-methylase UbiE